MMITEIDGFMKVMEAELPGCFELQPNVRGDARGCFVKTFHKTNFMKLQLPTEFKEEYYSVSRKGVLRGLHFQLPPMDHEKLVYCVVGKVLDVAVDLRKDSPTYGKYHLFTLDAEKGNMAYLPKGMAHGFYTLSETATMMYKVTSEYAPAQDSGILWNSVGIPWPDENPILSERDQKFVALKDFVSPF